jgi:hypothetical protein
VSIHLDRLASTIPPAGRVRASSSFTGTRSSPRNSRGPSRRPDGPAPSTQDRARWLPSQLVDRSASMIADALYAASRWNHFGIHLNKGLAGGPTLDYREAFVVDAEEAALPIGFVRSDQSLSRAPRCRERRLSKRAPPRRGRRPVWTSSTSGPVPSSAPPRGSPSLSVLDGVASFKVCSMAADTRGGVQAVRGRVDRALSRPLNPAAGPCSTDLHDRKVRNRRRI